MVAEQRAVDFYRAHNSLAARMQARIRVARPSRLSESFIRVAHPSRLYESVI